MWLSVAWPGLKVYSRDLRDLEISPLISLQPLRIGGKQAGREQLLYDQGPPRPPWALPGMADLAGWISAIETIESRRGC